MSIQPYLENPAGIAAIALAVLSAVLFVTSIALNNKWEIPKLKNVTNRAIPSMTVARQRNPEEGTTTLVSKVVGSVGGGKRVRGGSLRADDNTGLSGVKYSSRRESTTGMAVRPASEYNKPSEGIIQFGKNEVRHGATASKPEVVKPEVAKPEVVKPEVAKPEVSKPEPVFAGSHPVSGTGVFEEEDESTGVVGAIDDPAEDESTGVVGAVGYDDEGSYENTAGGFPGDEESTGVVGADEAFEDFGTGFGEDESTGVVGAEPYDPSLAEPEFTNTGFEDESTQVSDAVVQEGVPGVFGQPTDGVGYGFASDAEDESTSVSDGVHNPLFEEAPDSTSSEYIDIFGSGADDDSTNVVDDATGLFGDETSGYDAEGRRYIRNGEYIEVEVQRS